MELDLEVLNHLGRKHLAADALSPSPVSQNDDSDSDDNISAHEAAKIHAVAKHNGEQKFELLTVQKFLSAQEGDAYCCLLAVIVEALDRNYFCDKYDFSSRQTQPDGAENKAERCPFCVKSGSAQTWAEHDDIRTSWSKRYIRHDATDLLLAANGEQRLLFRKEIPVV